MSVDFAVVDLIPQWGVQKTPTDSDLKDQLISLLYDLGEQIHKEKKSVDPLNLNQWEFFVLPTEVLDLRQRSQHSITLKSLERLSGKSVTYFQLKNAVDKALKRNSQDTA